MNDIHTEGIGSAGLTWFKGDSLLGTMDCVLPVDFHLLGFEFKYILKYLGVPQPSRESSS